MRNFGLKVGSVTRLRFERRILELLEQSPHLRLIIEPLLEVRRVLREQFQHLHKAMGRLAESDDTCKLLMTAPGVGPMVALSSGPELTNRPASADLVPSPPISG